MSLESTIVDEKIRNVPISKVSTINTLDTNAHRKASVIEERFRMNLQPLVDEIQASNDEASTIYFNYNKPVKDLIRSFTEMTYRVGNFYTNMANGTPPKNTDVDQDQIKKLTEYGTNLFFGKAIWFTDREQQINKSNYFMEFQNKILESFSSTVKQQEKIKVNKPVNIDKQIDEVVKTITFLTLNTAVLLKTRQLTSEMTPSLVKLAARRIPELNRNISQEVVWVTAGDERVCWRYCAPLDGQTFNTLDPDMPIPILSTHRRCRCRLMNVDQKGNIALDLLLIASIMNFAQEATDIISPLDFED